MRKYDCNFDDYGLEFLNSITNKMIELFGITEDEAVGRINRRFSGQDFFDPERPEKEINIAYHEDEYYWANTLYYGKDSFWWIRKGEKIAPIPFP